VALLTLVVAGGTFGYVTIEGWGVWDALYMTVTTVATVGFREVHPLSTAGQAFTLLLIVTGVGTAFYTATLLATVIVEGGLHRRFERRPHRTHAGRTSRPLHPLRLRADRQHDCRRARSAEGAVRHHRTQSERVQSVLLRGWLAGGGRRRAATRSCERVGIHRARGLIAAVGTDAETSTRAHRPRVVRPGSLHRRARRIRRRGAEAAARGRRSCHSPYHIGAMPHGAERAAAGGGGLQCSWRRSSGHLDLSMEQVRIQDGSGWWDRRSSTPASGRSTA
jgi:voltage-gated potassium channel